MWIEGTLGQLDGGRLGSERKKEKQNSQFGIFRCRKVCVWSYDCSVTRDGGIQPIQDGGVEGFLST